MKTKQEVHVRDNNKFVLSYMHLLFVVVFVVFALIDGLGGSWGAPVIRSQMRVLHERNHQYLQCGVVIL